MISGWCNKTRLCASVIYRDMEEINIIKKLESLKATKPNNEWVISAKRDILSKEFVKEETTSTFATFISTCSRIFETPRILAPALSVMIVAVFGFALFSSQSTMPGDSLYSLKKAYDQVATSFLPADMQAIARINQADKLLVQLDNISKSSDNANRNIEAGVEEVKKAISIASREIKRVPEEKQAGLVAQLVSRVSEVEKTTNASIMDSESEEIIYSVFIKSEIKEFESNKDNLTESQLELLNNAKEYFALGDYASAMSSLYSIQPIIEEEEEE